MKEVPKKDLPGVSGGEYRDGGCIPWPRFPELEDPNYPSNPAGPVHEDGAYVDPTE